MKYLFAISEEHLHKEYNFLSSYPSFLIPLANQLWADRWNTHHNNTPGIVDAHRMPTSSVCIPKTHNRRFSEIQHKCGSSSVGTTYFTLTIYMKWILTLKATNIQYLIILPFLILKNLKTLLARWSWRLGFIKKKSSRNLVCKFCLWYVLFLFLGIGYN